MIGADPLPTASHLCCIVLWSGNLFSSMQRLRKVPKQVCCTPWTTRRDADHRYSMATRIAYAFILLVNSILSWLMLTPWAMKKLEHLTLDYMSITCQGKACYGYVAVQRINFALGLFHLILSILLIGVKSSKEGRAGLQNGYWGPKIIVWLVFVVLTFLIPESFFQVWGQYIAFIGAMLFVLLGLILLVDLAHTWAEYCLEKIENYDSKGWRFLLIGSTLGMYTSSFAMTIVMYIFFANGGCAMNQAAITVCCIQRADNRF